MHALDPAGTRDLVKQALEAGSKEVKVAAIECLGAEPDDLSYLLEQASAKAQDVRAGGVPGPGDHRRRCGRRRACKRPWTGKDLDLAADSLHKSRNAKLLKCLIAAAEGELAALRKTKDKKEIRPEDRRVPSPC